MVFMCCLFFYNALNFHSYPCFVFLLGNACVQKLRSSPLKPHLNVTLADCDIILFDFPVLCRSEGLIHEWLRDTPTWIDRMPLCPGKPVFACAFPLIPRFVCSCTICWTYVAPLDPQSQQNKTEEGGGTSLPTHTHTHTQSNPLSAP